jgi:large subunit ribosomal protein L32
MSPGAAAARATLLYSQAFRPAQRRPLDASAPGATRSTSNRGTLMAVQQNKKSPSKRGMHRSHNAVAAPGTGIEPTTGEVHLRHHISPTGFYRGRKVLKTKADA